MVILLLICGTPDLFVNMWNTISKEIINICFIKCSYHTWLVKMMKLIRKAKINNVKGDDEDDDDAQKSQLHYDVTRANISGSCNEITLMARISREIST